MYQMPITNDCIAVMCFLNQFKVATSSMESLFMAAKTFIPLLADQEGASFLAITGNQLPMKFWYG